jgi:uracil-DNA glycosylase
MMATAELIRAYLDWQSEMGSDEVILPAPLMKKNAQPAPAQGSAPGRGEGRGTAPGSHSQAPGYTPPPLTGHAGTPAASPAPPGIPDASAAAWLFQSLSQALEKSAESRRRDSPLAAGLGRTAVPRAEAFNFPVFANLDGFWQYMETRPRLLQGEFPAQNSGEDPGSRESGVARVIPGTGPAKAPLALIGFEPGEADASEGKPFRGDAGALLEKMMRAIRMETGDLYLSNLIKVPAPGKAWSRRELARILPLLHIELGLAQVPMVLLLGQECAQTVLKTGKTLDELRQETHRMEGREFFVTYHPQELLRKEELKRKAWEDLQWLQRRMAEAQARP